MIKESITKTVDIKAVQTDAVAITNDYHHPLEYHWNLWVFTNDKKCWEENLVCVADFNTVENFWSLYHYTKRPSELKPGQDYLMFKKDIQPTWDHPGNEKGGRWIINIDKKPNSLDSLWLLVVLLIIGENLPHGDIISGIVVNVRAKNKIALWLSDGSNIHKVRDIGRALKDNVTGLGKINFHLHQSNVNMITI